MEEKKFSKDNFIAFKVKSKFFPWFRTTQQKRNPCTVRNACLVQFVKSRRRTSWGPDWACGACGLFSELCSIIYDAKPWCALCQAYRTGLNSDMLQDTIRNLEASFWLRLVPFGKVTQQGASFQSTPSENPFIEAACCQLLPGNTYFMEGITNEGHFWRACFIKLKKE